MTKNMDVKRTRLSARDAVIEALRDYLLDNHLGPNDPLPTEQAFAEALGVSRNILREGIEHFKTLGIIETRPKTGARVKNLFPENPFKGYIPYIRRDPKRMADVMDFRLFVELGASETILSNISPAALDELDDIARKLKDVSDDESKKLEARFHSALLGVCGNSLLDCLRPLIADFFDNSADVEAMTKRKAREIIAAEHAAIVAAARKKDLSAFQAALRRHYVPASSDI